MTRSEQTLSAGHRSAGAQLRGPVGVATGVAALTVLIAVGAGVAGPLRSSGPRWMPAFDRAAEPIPGQTRETEEGFEVLPMPEVPQGPEGPDLMPFVWAVAVVVVLVAAWLVWRRWRASRVARLRSSAGPAATGTVVAGAAATSSATSASPHAPTVRHGLGRALDALDSDRTPGDAVVAAWQGLEDAAGRAGLRRAPAQTPTEFTARVVARDPQDARAVQDLLRVYLRARFGAAPVTAAEVDTARRCVAALASSWDPAGAGAGATAGAAGAPGSPRRTSPPREPGARDAAGRRTGPDS